MGRIKISLSKIRVLGVDLLIFVTLGTQDKPFPRLLEAIQKQIDNGNIKKDEKIVVQSGCTKFESADMEIMPYMDIKEFNKNIEDADIVICHAGVGTLLAGLKKNKKIIAAARLKKYGEHVNDHQLQILENFSNAGHLVALEDFDKLDELLKDIKDFNPKPFNSNNNSFIESLTKEIEKYK